MIVIGVDPGTLKTGFGIVEHSQNQSKKIFSGTICPSAKKPIEQRYANIFSEIESLILAYQPTVLAIETQFVGVNVQSAIKLGMARGVCLLAAARKKLSVIEFSPTRTKKAVTGKGHATKHQMQNMVKMLLHLPQIPQEDEADALALALCYIHTQRSIPSSQSLIYRR